MPALNITFTDDEMESLRSASADAGQSLRTFAREAIVSASDAHKQQVREAARIVAARSAELNRRLA
ncbi:MAG: antitoxin Phd [Tomitella sp.]|nr:antitoxin Phd [Tomitella sp.]